MIIFQLTKIENLSKESFKHKIICKRRIALPHRSNMCIDIQPDQTKNGAKAAKGTAARQKVYTFELH